MRGPILILGGTAEGRSIAEALQSEGISFVLSLAGRTEAPLTVGVVRTGGFGGVDGLAAYLISHEIETVVDATHPFATSMSRNAARACGLTGARLIRLDRPGWEAHADATGWDWVDGHHEAASAVKGRRVFLTVGRLHTLDYSPALDDRLVVARVAEPPGGPIPPLWELLIARGPFSIDGERDLFHRFRFDTLITKDSGGAHTSAKLTAAAEYGAHIIVIRRALPPEGVETATSVEQVLALLR